MFIQDIDNNIKKYIEKELQKFYQKYISFRAVKITDNPQDSFGVNNFNSSTAVPANSVGQNQFKDEIKTITISDTNTSGTTTITSGSIIIGWYISNFTGTPSASYVKLSISGTTLQASLSQSPGAGNSITITIILLKI